MRGATINANSLWEQAIYISIHAPMRGATTYNNGYSYHLSISIHAPMRGATTFCTISSVRLLDFNPRAHEGRDKFLYCDTQDINTISIHAPMRGATLNEVED